MSTAITTMVPERLTFSREQIELLKGTIAKGATDDELDLFLEVCKSKKLDPFSKEIHAIKRWDSGLRREVISFQVGIDGFRRIAERSGRYGGQAPYQWCGADGVWKDVWLSPEPPAAAKSSIYKTGFAEPVTRVALYREYVQTTKDGEANTMWKKMPANQLAKCAEALAIRAAFPELAGLYTQEEMGQAQNPVPQAPPTPKRTMSTTKRVPQQPMPVDITPAPTEALEAEAVPEELNAAPGYGAYRAPAEEELRNGLRAGLETIPKITQAWTALEADFQRAGCEYVLADIQTKFGRTQDGARTPLSMRTAVIVAQRWRDDNMALWLKPAQVTQ